DDLDTVAGQIGYHYEAAGETEKAIGYYLRAAAAAQRVYATEEARKSYQRVLSLAAQDSCAMAPQRVEAMLGLGRIQLGHGDPLGAEETLRSAIDLARQAQVAPGDVARCYHWLGQALFVLDKTDAQAEASLEALALLGDKLDVAEAALLQVVTPMGPLSSYDEAEPRPRQLWYQAGEVVAKLPYRPELASVYQTVLSQLLRDRKVEEGERWLRLWERKLQEVPDVRGIGLMHQRWEDLLWMQGRLQEAIAHLQQAVATLSQTGESVDGIFWHWRMAFWCLQLGDLNAAFQHMQESARWREAVPSPYYRRWGQLLRGLMLRCAGDAAGAEQALAAALQLSGGTDRKIVPWLSHLLLGQLKLGRGDREAALQHFQAASALSKPGMPRPLGGWIMVLPNLGLGQLLGALEAAAPDSATFRELCRRFPHRHTFIPDAASDERGIVRAPSQWYLTPATSAPGGGRAAFVLPNDRLTDAWTWQDPCGDCAYAFLPEPDGAVEVLAANGRDLWLLNRGAPRLLHALPDSGSTAGFVLEAMVSSARSDRPAIGGLLLWIDDESFLRLDWGALGPRDMAILVCKQGKDMLIGRGRLPDLGGHHLPGPAPRPARVWIRLEVRGEEVRALVSVDAARWWCVGTTNFPLTRNAQAGFYASGWIDRILYPGAWPEGAGMRFASVSCRALQ
ncbi:MAG: hypothetical protein JXC32_22635, partial [Anaerolineae bacterium]|nr:hypothetical protein [Anaerolineae bacterium]